MIRPALLSLRDDELIVDSFAGGGGASEGIFEATGRHPDIAINHDAEAIAMHKANHPRTKHYIESVWKVDPHKATGGRPVGLFWLSPDCTHFSKAKGAKPVSKKVRGLAWVAVRWAAAVRPRVISLENVEEFLTWGPVLDSGRPCPVRKGKTFRAFVRKLVRLGYDVEHREYRACDFGAPTIRKRLFLVARCDGEPIRWPVETHGPGRPTPWHTAAECIDWDIPCPSIFAPGRNLCENTLRRIARGILRYIVHNQTPFIVTLRGTTDSHINRSARGINGPLRTISAGGGDHHALVAATLINTRNGERFGQLPRVRDINQPFPTVTAIGSQGALVTAFIARHFGGHENDGTQLSLPLPTITTKDHHALVYAFLLKYYGTDQNPQIDQPLHTITTKDRFAIITVRSEQYYIADIGMRHLTARELYNAQSFRADYNIAPWINGKTLPQTAQKRMCGNSVPPKMARAIVLAQFMGGAQEAAA